MIVLTKKTFEISHIQSVEELNHLSLKLNEKEQIIVSKRFFDGRTQMEVAEEIGISQAQVSRLEKSAIEHIKRFYK